MAQEQAAPFDLHCQPLCHACAGETRTIYVWLMSGKTVRIGNVRSVRLTSHTITFDCAGEGAGHAVEFRRRDVYFTSCQLTCPPVA